VGRRHGRRLGLRELSMSSTSWNASPDRLYYEQLAQRIGGNRACVAVARKLLKRSIRSGD
jgi:hypothetical protein